MTNKKEIEKKSIRSPEERRVIKLNEGSAKARKSAARLAAVQVLYQMDMNEQGARSALKDFINHRIGFDLDGDVFVPADQDLLTKIIMGIYDRREDIEQIVMDSLKEGGHDGVEDIMRDILYAGIYELLAHGDIDKGIIISDYLNVAHAFYEGGEPKLINAILDKVAKAVRN